MSLSRLPALPSAPPHEPQAERLHSSRAALASEALASVAARLTKASELPDHRVPEMVSSGVAALDVLTGGVPRGAITEISGAASSGRTSLLLAAMAAATARGESCALIDATDSFDPQSAAAAGVNLSRVLWVRCNGELPKKEGAAPRFVENDFGGHDYVSAAKAHKPSPWQQKNRPLYARLEQALRAADLVLQAGGFGLVALDFAGLPVEVARRVPMTTWFRFKRAVEPTPAAMLVVQRESLAQACASLAVRVQRKRATRDVSKVSAANLLRGFEVNAEMLRDPSQRKKPAKRETLVETRAEWA